MSSSKVASFYERYRDYSLTSTKQYIFDAELMDYGEYFITEEKKVPSRMDISIAYGVSNRNIHTRWNFFSLVEEIFTKIARNNPSFICKRPF